VSVWEFVGQEERTHRQGGMDQAVPLTDQKGGRAAPTGGTSSVFCARATILLLLCLTAAGCAMGDIFKPHRRVTGDYCLEQWEEGRVRYVLVGCGPTATLKKGHYDNGIVDGSVERVGWDQRFIIAWRRAVARADGDGWMVVDTKSQTIEGPFGEEAWATRRQDVPDWEAIEIHEVDLAWKLLD